MDLTKDQFSFLRSQNIQLSRVFDATGMPTKQWKQEMSRLGMEVAIGVTPCNKSRHTIRTRSGHCAQCNTHSFAYSRRYHKKNYIYVASSRESNLIKVGTAEDIDEREKTLNYFGYGQANDWRIQHKELCENAGCVEKRTHESLSEYWIRRNYKKQGRVVDCEELFRCEVVLAVVAIKMAIIDLGLRDEDIPL